MKKLIIFYALLIFLSGNFSAKIYAQSNDEEIVSATLTASSQTVSSGETIMLSLKLNLIPDAHANSNSPADPNLIATVFTPNKTEGVQWGEVKYPKPTTAMASYSVEPLSVFEDGATITVPATITSATVQQLTLGGILRIQVCDKYQCYPPKKIPVSVQIQIKDGKTDNTTPIVQQNNITAGKQSSDLSKVSEAVDFDFVDFDGKPRKFSEFKGKIVLIDFWATWCSPCLKDIPKLKVLYDKYKAQGFEIIGMDSETIGDEETPDPEFAKETAERAKQIVKTRGANWVHANSATAVPIAKKIFDVKALPTKILIDKNGKIVARIGEKDDLEKAVVALMEAK